MALQRAVNDFGPVAIAAFTATSRIEQVIWWSVGIVWFLSGFIAWFRYMWYNKKKIPSEKTGKCRCGAIIYGQ